MTLLRHASVRYALVGLSNTAIGLAVIWLALKGFALGNVAANVAGYAVAFVWSFTLNRRWTFGHRGAVSTGLVRYTLVCAIAYAANLLIVILIGAHVGERSVLAQLGGMATYTLLAYLGSRCFAFPASQHAAAN